ncbi:MAG: 4'-phosphopantetheinyl transferase superfamily protein [Bacteroidales bacterium]|nr:4'-phosphopantetheinyl transferase superfamily protein [Bacteroidales bacterium]
MGLYLKKSLDSYTSLAIWQVVESNEELEVMLRPDQILELVKYKNPKRRKEKLAARVLLNKMVSEKARIFYDSNGKPHLAYSPYSISISHSKDYVAVVLSLKSNVGVDIQYMTDKIYRIVPRFLHKDEYQNIHPSFPDQSLHIHWCAKEALYKIHGKRQLNFANQLRVYPFRVKDKGIIKGKILKDNEQKECELTYTSMDENYMLVWGATN